MATRDEVVEAGGGKPFAFIMFSDDLHKHLHDLLESQTNVNLQINTDVLQH